MRRPPSTVAESDQGLLVLFFELFLDRRTEASRRAERFAVVVERKTGNVNGLGARGGLLLDDDGHGTAFDAVAERQAASAGETRVRESLQHLARLYYMKARAARPRGAARRRRVPRKRRAGVWGGAPRDQSSALISRSNCAFVAGPRCFVQIDPSRAMKNVVG